MGAQNGKLTGAALGVWFYEKLPFPRPVNVWLEISVMMNSIIEKCQSVSCRVPTCIDIAVQ
jgi:hypothetical protein